MDFKLSLLESITNDFSEEQKIGSGGYGDVYKGVHNGEEIAVKKFHPLQGLDDKNFDNEFRNLSRITHPNVVRLIGYCYEARYKYVVHNGEIVLAKATEQLLCFEYLQGGDLGKHIADESCELDWPTCYKIIKGTCEGLNHLHNEQEKPIFHLDLNPSNILLGKDMTAKIAGFGLARSLLDPEITHMTELVRGTLGYMPQEYMYYGRISNKFDVFSLGVIIIKIVAGNSGYSRYCEKGAIEFIDLVCETWEERLLQETSMYSSHEMDISRVKACVEIALRCVEDNRNKRPCIMDIVHELEELERAWRKKLSLHSKKDGHKSVTPIGLDDLIRDVSVEPISLPLAVLQDITENFADERKTGQGGFGIIYKDGHKSVTTTDLDDLVRDVSVAPINLPLAVLQDITENFADERKIGQGGFGIVYKGVLQNGSIAVKKLLNSQTIEDEPFYREATFLMSVKHQNIVRFLGYCANTENKAIKIEGSGRREKYIYTEIRERLLCFEYISNGGLDNHLTDELGGLEWNTRYQIIKGICEGLQYLHKEKYIAHMDLKPANILLDDLMVPKITDFGISRYLDGISKAVTKGCLASVGYCAPEYLHHGEVSFKSDIFSLGVIIKDIVTGRKEDPDSKNVLRRWRYRWNRSAKYPPLGYRQISKCIEIAVSCMAENPKQRPFISDIISALNEMENTNEHLISADESMVGQISTYPWELLEIDPLQLNFPFKPNKQISSSLELNNERDDCIAFDVQKPSILQYCVEPKKGIVPPRSKCNVIITLQAPDKEPDGMLCKDKFVVRCAIVNDGLTTENINEDVFDEKLGKVVDEVTLTVAFNNNK